jgi:hypothetical protein
VKARKAEPGDAGRGGGCGPCLDSWDGASAGAPSSVLRSLLTICAVRAVRLQDRDERGNFHQKYDGELVKDELRPIVFEEIRLQASRGRLGAGGMGGHGGR